MSGATLISFQDTVAREVFWQGLSVREKRRRGSCVGASVDLRGWLCDDFCVCRACVDAGVWFARVLFTTGVVDFHQRPNGYVELTADSVQRLGQLQNAVDEAFAISVEPEYRACPVPLCCLLGDVPEIGGWSDPVNTVPIFDIGPGAAVVH